MTVSIELIKEENQKVLDFIKTFQSKNEYNPKFLDEYNSKFNAEFKDYLQSNNFSQETLNTFLSNN